MEYIDTIYTLRLRVASYKAHITLLEKEARLQMKHHGSVTERVQGEINDYKELVALGQVEMTSVDEELRRVARRLNDVKMKVFYYRFVRKLPILSISKRMNYTPIRIKQIINEIKGCSDFMGADDRA